MEKDRILLSAKEVTVKNKSQKPSNLISAENKKTPKNIKILKKKRYKEAVSDFVSEGGPIIEPESNEEKDKSTS